MVAMTVSHRAPMVERADRGGHRLRQRMEPQRHLGDHAERAFGSDEEPRQVVARRGLAGPPPVWITRPSASTTVSPSTFSRIVP